MQEREQGISSAFGDAKAAQDRMQSLLEQYNASLAEAKQKSATAYNTIYQQGLDAQRDMIAAERTKAGEMLDKARARDRGGVHGGAGGPQKRSRAAVAGYYRQAARKGGVDRWKDRTMKKTHACCIAALFALVAIPVGGCHRRPRKARARSDDLHGRLAAAAGQFRDHRRRLLSTS